MTVITISKNIKLLIDKERLIEIVLSRKILLPKNRFYLFDYKIMNGF